MKAEILCVGTELLLGDVVNTNAAYISKELANLGIDMYYHSVVGDNPMRLQEMLANCFERSDIIVLTGGLGPTYDDLTKETVAQYFNLQLELHEPTLTSLDVFLKKLNREMTKNNKKQAYVPLGAEVFKNDFGTAPGIGISKNSKTAVLLPGPPKEMIPMFDNYVVPYLSKLTNKVFVSRKVNLFGIGESTVEDIVKDIMTKNTNPTVAPYVSEGEMYLRITASGKDKQECEKLIKPVHNEIYNRLGEYIYAADAKNIQSELVKLLLEKKLKIAVAESCTGGLIAKKITDIAGVSPVFDMGVCTYSNEAKIKLLGVSSETLNKHGAVSSETAIEMAQGLLTLSKSDIALSTTGIAGPDGGTIEKPVGTVYIAVAAKNTQTQCEKLNLSSGRNRDMIRMFASANAIYAAFECAKNLRNS